MSPRKKSKPNPKAPADGNSLEPESSTATNTTNTTSNTPTASELFEIASSNKSVAGSANTTNENAIPEPSGEQSLNKKPSRKWYGGTGSWRSKAPAVAKLAKESIGVTGGATSELPGEEAEKDKEQSPKKFLTKRKSSKGDAIPASMTKLNVSSDGSINQTEDSKSGEVSKKSDEIPPPKVDEPPLPPAPQKTAGTERADNKGEDKQLASTWGWRSWWSRPDGYSENTKSKDDSKQDDTADAQRTPLPEVTPSEDADADTKMKELGNGEAPESKPDQVTKEITEAENTPQTTNDTGVKNASSTSWFWLWSSAQNAQTNPSPTEAPAESPTPAQPTSDSQAPIQPEPVLVPPPQANIAETGTKAPPKSSGWAFWSREKPNGDDNGDPNSPQKQVGELAVSDTPSQSHPEAAQFNEQEPPPQKQPSQKKPAPQEPAPKQSFRSLRGRPKAKDASKNIPKDPPSSSKPTTPSKTSPTHSPTRPEAASAPQPAPKQASKSKQEPENILLPGFRNTYHLVQKPSYWQQIRQYFLGGEPAMPHLHINPAPPRIKKAIAIGVHGYFPAPLLQKVLGQPTGTSVRFANAAAAAIQDWTATHGYSTEIEKVALEGEGFVAERVNTLWKLLLNWIEHIKAADFILVACHSQGVPVAIMLVAKLVQMGCVDKARIGLCAMAGVNMGPFAEYKTRYLGATAAELFQFSDPKSLVSQMYLAALEEVLRFGVRILYVGSIDDQLVSLESSTFSTLSHPYIYRAVFVDGRIHAPDFLTHLVGFALKLRNLGLPDHGLIRELSPALAGSLYSGEGHSRIYEDPHVYELAVLHALETTSLPMQPQQRPSTSGLSGIRIPVPGEERRERYALKVRDYEGVGTGNQNPYFLPWAMRGLLEEEFVKKELGNEVEELLGLFEGWKPNGKGLKDVKFRLEGVRSKL
ncbi:hypothetical protein K469DRAFT_631807 [Zopfia rhizophila CBS 207.26]|uniref:YMC020W-like alpha/beta hydrolase domain-containing protein n=1 Tax=Zopfia rhizophila CBS 207.26 TaxID=1314779 RepID=A0A6A6E260_9PEZI|nr:hypothetical protein K469DRAFT_631807 [Zopfia rhizophila CBS 207.26]